MSFLIIKEDAQTLQNSPKHKEGFGKLLLAMLAVFIKFGKPVWEAVLSPIKVSNNLEY